MRTTEEHKLDLLGDYEFERAWLIANYNLGT